MKKDYTYYVDTVRSLKAPPLEELSIRATLRGPRFQVYAISLGLVLLSCVAVLTGIHRSALTSDRALKAFSEDPVDVPASIDTLTRDQKTSLGSNTLAVQLLKPAAQLLRSDPRSDTAEATVVSLIPSLSLTDIRSKHAESQITVDTRTNSRFAEYILVLPSDRNLSPSSFRAGLSLGMNSSRQQTGLILLHRIGSSMDVGLEARYGADRISQATTTPIFADTLVQSKQGPSQVTIGRFASEDVKTTHFSIGALFHYRMPEIHTDIEPTITAAAGFESMRGYAALGLGLTYTTGALNIISLVRVSYVASNAPLAIGEINIMLGL
jgi:hypothetical protein